MREINLQGGRFAIVDDQDYARLAHYPWYFAGRYVRRNVRLENGKKSTILMHRQITGLCVGDKRHVDHANGNTLDNSRANLRYCNMSQNLANSRYSEGISGYRGVSWHKRAGRWQAHCNAHQPNSYLGLFDTERGAAKAYDAAARASYGEFARLNFPKEPK